jgi:type 1 glutamine amidotransferase
LHSDPLNCLLVAAGKYHDIDFARLEILKRLGERAHIRTRVHEDFEDLDALRWADVIISYTCDIIPTDKSALALKSWLEDGGRWLALHGTNSILRMMDDGLWYTPRDAPVFMAILGSQFISHPPIAPYIVENVQRTHPLVAGIEDFEVADELYHMELHGDLDIYLEASCDGVGRGFAEGASAKGRHPVFYQKHHNKGAVLYLTLGHCRGHFDLRPHKDFLPELDRGSWNTPEFNTLLDRSIEWLRCQN